VAGLQRGSASAASADGSPAEPVILSVGAATGA
jgi:hypothetical protein